MNIAYSIAAAVALLLHQPQLPKFKIDKNAEPMRIAIAFDGETRKVIQYDKEIFSKPPTCNGDSAARASNSIQCLSPTDRDCYRRKMFHALHHCGADMKKVRELWGKP